MSNNSKTPAKYDPIERQRRRIVSAYRIYSKNNPKHSPRLIREFQIQSRSYFSAPVYQLFPPKNTNVSYINKLTGNNLSHVENKSSQPEIKKEQILCDLVNHLGTIFRHN